MGQFKVLYIEDNEFNRILVKRVLMVEDMIVAYTIAISLYWAFFWRGRQRRQQAVA